MTINISLPNAGDTPELRPRITVFGVGGAGGNAVNNMIQMQLEGVDFVVSNTDAQALSQSRTDRRIQLGAEMTRGLGAGSRPDVGAAAAEESLETIVEHLQGSNMAFITGGMGGGTGTGGMPVIARAARDHGILTVGVVTKPFHFEGANRMRIAEAGITEMEQFVDTLIVIPNQNLFRVANEKTTFAEAFSMADQVLYSGVRGVTDLMVMPGLINLDFADIRAVMSEMGKAMMGTGEADGERRALDASEMAIANPLLDDTSLSGATGVLINITGGRDMTLFEVDEAANRIRAEVDPEAHIIFGSTFDDSLEGRMRVSIVATGMAADVARQPAPTLLDVKTSRPEVAKTTAPPAASQPAAEAATPPPAAKVVEMRPVADAPQVAPEAPMAPSAADHEGQMAAPEVAQQAAIPTAAMTVEEAFIPPPPAMPEPAPTTERADPFASADMENGATSEPEQADAEPAISAASSRRGPSLFERVTGTGRGPWSTRGVRRKEPEAPQVHSEGPPATPVASSADPAPMASAPAPAPQSLAPAPAPQPLAAEPAPAAQPRLGGLEAPAQGPTAEPADEDLLDIPAFLRRQAN